jgi:hypothetical protein
MFYCFFLKRCGFFGFFGFFGLRIEPPTFHSLPVTGFWVLMVFDYPSCPRYFLFLVERLLIFCPSYRQWSRTFTHPIHLPTLLLTTQ